MRLLLRWLSPSLLGPSAGRGRRGQAPPDPPAPSTPAARLVLLCVAPSCLLLSNFARNSPVAISEFELVSLELQRFWAVSKSDRGKLRADLVSPRPCHRPRAPLSFSNFARNSPAACSNIEFVSLELQRFRAVSKSDHGKLCATFAEVVIAVTLGSLCRSRAPWSGSSVPSGALHTGGPRCAVRCHASRCDSGQAPPPASTTAWSARLLCVQHFRT